MRRGREAPSSAEAHRFRERYGPWALIAGASEGIGGAWADFAAARGLSLVLVARRRDELEAKRAEIVERFGVEVTTIAQDLATPDLLDRLLERVEGREIGLLVYNAALASVGGFFEHSLDFERQRLAVNCAGPLALSHHFGLQMVRRRRGGIVLMSSGTGLIGSPYYTHYGATKAYDIGLAEGLWFELRPHGVDVLACIAGLTSSPGLAAALARGAARGGFVMTPDDVVSEAARSLGRRPSVVVGAPNRRKLWLVTRLLPRARGVRAIGAHALANFLGGKIPDLPDAAVSSPGAGRDR